MDIKEQAKQYYLEGIPIKDIADKLGKTAGPVRSWKYHGKWEGNLLMKNIKSLRRMVRRRTTKMRNVAMLVVSEGTIEELADSYLNN